jgi:hypothetical protein
VVALQRDGEQAQAPLPPLVAHCWCAGQSDSTGPVEQTPDPAEQVTSRPDAHDVPGTHWPDPVCPGQESAALLHVRSLPQPWSVGQFWSEVHGAPVVVTEQAASRARNTGGASRRIERGDYQNRPPGRPGRANGP